MSYFISTNRSTIFCNANTWVSIFDKAIQDDDQLTLLTSDFVINDDVIKLFSLIKDKNTIALIIKDSNFTPENLTFLEDRLPTLPKLNRLILKANKTTNVDSSTFNKIIDFVKQNSTLERVIITDHLGNKIFLRGAEEVPNPRIRSRRY